MLAKLAVRNVRRSARDYAIYFVTIVFGVAVFYAFNSIGSQQILFDVESEASASTFELTENFLLMFSVLIAFVLGFLIVYANRFLIKRRKKEFGTYLLLGMKPSSLSLIVLMETAMVGLASLAVGLVLGFALSQVLSFATASLLEFTMEEYRFVFSSDALVVTLACFAAIYATVALLNLFSVNRFKLIDLLSANSRSESNPIRKPWVCLMVFVVSLVTIGAAYWNLNENGLVMLTDESFARATAFMLVGTLLFFWSLAGFAIAVLTRAKEVYFKHLRMFTLRQVASKVNTAFVSLWVVCVMLFFSVTVFSTGMSLVDAFTKDIEKAAPFDATLRADVYYEQAHDAAKFASTDVAERRRDMAANDPDVYALASSWGFNALAKLESDLPGWGEVVREAAELDYYEVAGTSYGPLVDASGQSTGLEESDRSLSESNLLVISLSQFNATRSLLGQETLVLADGECAVNNTLDMSEDIARGIAEARLTVDIMGFALTFVGEPFETQTMTTMMPSAPLEIVVPDYVVEQLKAQGAIPLYTYVNLMYREKGEESDAALREGVRDMYLSDITAGIYDDEWVEQIEAAVAADQMPITIWPVTMMTEQSQMLAQAGGIRLLVTYLALYIGFVLLIATAAILAIQQLSDTADSLSRYRTLSRLGCDDRMISQSLLQQVLLYFLLPLALAVCHSACAVSILADVTASAWGVSVAGPIAMAAALVIVVYGGYMTVTYLASRAMVRSQMA